VLIRPVPTTLTTSPHYITTSVSCILLRTHAATPRRLVEPLAVPLTVDVKVGNDWEGMTPLTREDAALAEADEAPEELPAAASVV